MIKFVTTNSLVWLSQLSEYVCLIGNLLWVCLLWLPLATTRKLFSHRSARFYHRSHVAVKSTVMRNAIRRHLCLSRSALLDTTTCKTDQIGKDPVRNISGKRETFASFKMVKMMGEYSPQLYHEVQLSRAAQLFSFVLQLYAGQPSCLVFHLASS